jgi:hypothetical protein
MIRESEDLPAKCDAFPWTRGVLTDLADRKGIPRSINFGLGFFYASGSKKLMNY